MHAISGLKSVEFSFVRTCFVLLSLAYPGQAGAATWKVGPSEAITRIADVAKKAKDGDVIEISSGEYRGDVAVWHQKQLTLRGIGQKPVLLAEGNSAEGKGIWVLRDGSFLIENIEFRGARVKDGNGAGIRFEAGQLTVRDCTFIDNQTGILTSNRTDAELTIENSLFAQAPHQEHSLPHLLYVGQIDKLILSGSRFHGGYRGHLIKSRARLSDIRYNLIHDGAGEASYEIDLPNGGIGIMVGNVVEQGAKSQNPTVIAYGAEGQFWRKNTLFVIHNTLINRRPFGGQFLRVWKERLAGPLEVNIINNLTMGPGMLMQVGEGKLFGNHSARQFPPGTMEFPSFRLPAESTLRGSLAIKEHNDGTENLRPRAEFKLPIGIRPLPPPERWTPGAFQTPYRPEHDTPTDRSAP